MAEVRKESHLHRGTTLAKISRRQTLPGGHPSSVSIRARIIAKLCFSYYDLPSPDMLLVFLAIYMQ